MKAAVWRGVGQLHVESIPVPVVTPGSVLLRVKACAVCGSDLRIYGDGNPRIQPPRVLGHEIAGEVVAVAPDVATYKVGDRLCLGADVPCGTCRHCREGRANCCDTNLAVGYQFDGGYAEYMRLDPTLVAIGPLQRMSASLSYDVAALSEPLACCLNGYERVFAQPDSTVVVFGAGPIGLMLAMLAREYRARQVIVIEPSPWRRDCANAWASALTLDPADGDPVDTVLSLTAGQGAEIVFTACPVPETHEQAVRMLAKRGVANFFGGLPKTARAISLLSNHLHYREAYVTGSHGSTPDQHRRALELIEHGQIDLRPLVSHTVRLEDILEGFQLVHSGKAMKVVVHPDGR